MMLEYWIWLTTLPRIGPVTANRLMKKFGHPENVYHGSEEDLKKMGDLTTAQRNSLLENKDLDDAKRILEECERKHISLLPLEDPRYPKRARNCKDTPILLYYKGKLQSIDQSVGIVGTRRCTQETKHLVASLAEANAKKHVAVVSGMAKGVDSYAHTACLQTGGYTIAVLANGLDICYPSEHAKLKECLEKDGLLISEYPPGTYPARYTFPERNRIISAWSDELIVVAAGKGSGAHITAKFSDYYGRKITYM